MNNGPSAVRGLRLDAEGTRIPPKEARGVRDEGIAPCQHVTRDPAKSLVREPEKSAPAVRSYTSSAYHPQGARKSTTISTRYGLGGRAAPEPSPDQRGPRPARKPTASRTPHRAVRAITARRQRAESSRTAMEAENGEGGHARAAPTKSSLALRAACSTRAARRNQGTPARASASQTPERERPDRRRGSPADALAMSRRWRGTQWRARGGDADEESGTRAVPIANGPGGHSSVGVSQPQPRGPRHSRRSSAHRVDSTGSPRAGGARSRTAIATGSVVRRRRRGGSRRRRAVPCQH